MVRIKRVVFGLILFLAVGQLIRFPRTNPPIDPTHEVGASIPLTPMVAETFNRSCNDCHSNRTVWPWYSNVAPASWLVIYDTDHARRRMNLSEWDAITPQQQKRALDRMCSDVTRGDMPEWQYLIIHTEARLSSAEVQAVCDWSKTASASLLDKAGGN
jgi:hypothetical protein